MCQVALSIPEEVIYDTKMNSRETEAFVRQSVAQMYYTTKGVSLGYCAGIAGMSKMDFVRFLASKGISIFRYDDEAELLEDVKNA